MNQKTNETLNKLRLGHLHISFRLLSETQWLEDTQRQIPHDIASTVKTEIALLLEVEADALHRMPLTCC